MKTIISILVLVTFFTLNGLSQDEIYKKNSEKIECKVEEVTEDKIKYHKEDNMDGPLYSIAKKEVLVIVYENGTYEYPNIRKEDIQTEEINEFGAVVPKEAYTDFKRNLISINPLNLFHGNINLAYQHIFESGKTALRIPVKIGFDNENNLDYFLPSATDQKVVGSLELDFLYYPTGQHLVSYVTGLGLEGGAVNVFNQESSIWQGGQLIERYSHETNSYMSIFFYNGLAVEAGSNFGLSVLLGLGPKRFLDVEKKTEFMMNFSFNLGYSF